MIFELSLNAQIQIYFWCMIILLLGWYIDFFFQHEVWKDFRDTYRAIKGYIQKRKEKNKEE